MLRALIAIAIMFFPVASLASGAYGAGSRTGARFGASGGGASGAIPTCTVAQLQAGSCQTASTGYLATIVDGLSTDADRCGAAAAGGGSDVVTCRYSGSAWTEFPVRGAVVLTLCSSEAGTGICDDGSGVDYRADVSDYSLLTFTSAGSTGSYRCQIYQSPTVISISDTDLTGDGTVASRFDLSNITQESVTLVAGFGSVWLDCTSNTGSVTATVRAQR